MSGLPRIIQGGMGVGVSNWRLAQAVSRLGQLGVVSGTAIEQIFARRLQDGDPGGHMRRGLDRFPFPAMAERVWSGYYTAGGRPEGSSYRTPLMNTKEGTRELKELCIVANFVEVTLAREGHGNPVGINYLEKVQLPHLPSLYGAMLAGVGYVLMGAGIPLKIPGVLDRFAQHQPASYPLQVTGAAPGEDTALTLDPADFLERELPPLARPRFLAIISSNVLAATMLKRANGAVNGFIIEGPTAGGHNAPPRGKLQFDEAGEVLYGERDRVDLEKIRGLGLPFWLAGGYGDAGMLRAALAAGAAGVQVGTAFAFCRESGLREDYKLALLQKVAAGQARVSTDVNASPTAFPFKVASLEGTLSEEEHYLERPRICDLGYLREAFKTNDGSIDYRCPAEPVSLYASKGGREEDTVGKKCLCNALLATVGQPQRRKGKYEEKGLVTSGNDLARLTRFLPAEGYSYSAADVIAKLLES